MRRRKFITLIGSAVTLPFFRAPVTEAQEPGSFAGTKRQAQIECARLISELKGGLYIDPTKITVGQFLDRWLEHIKPLVSPRTRERYGEIVSKNINPLLGAVVLTKLLPIQISDAYAKALFGGRREPRRACP
jgi:hypothetical protein